MSMLTGLPNLLQSLDNKTRNLLGDAFDGVKHHAGGYKAEPSGKARGSANTPRRSHTRGATSSSSSSKRSFSAKTDYIRYEMTDLNGKSLSKIVPARHQDDEVFMYSGILACGANAEVLCFPEEVTKAGNGNSALTPDWTTLIELPWASSTERRLFSVLCEQEACRPDVGRPHPCCPRSICKRLLAELAAFDDRGLEIMSSIEHEFSVCKETSPGEYQPAWRGVDIFATLQNNESAELSYEIQEQMFDVGIDVKTINAEYGEGQLEITLAPVRGISGPDSATTFRTGVKEICVKHDLTASFFTSPLHGSGNGLSNGGHFNFSLWEGDKAVTRTKDSGSLGLSKTMQHFLAGLMEHAGALEALCSPTPACYTRHGHWAPTRADWGVDDRTAMCRLKTDDANSNKAYVELRMPSGAANPYLVMAGLAAAGLDGLKRSLPLQPAKGAEAGDEASNVIKPAEGQLLPTTLEDALAALESDAVMVEALGKPFVRWYTMVKHGEIDYIEKHTKAGGDSEEARGKAWQRTYLKFV